MIGRVVEVAEDGRHLSVYRGFMVVEENGAEIGRVPLDDIAVLVINAHGVSYTNTLITTLAIHGTAMVVCGNNFRPVAWLWPIEGHHLQAARMAAQLSMPRPLGKRLWKKLVQAKVRQQGAVLEGLGKSSGGFDLLARRVRSGDPDNVEAQAARRYWPLLLGDQFRRDPDGGGINGLLNYGYAILRGATARAVVAAGLHPSLGIHHRNQFNSMALVDDVLEPFRPLIDLAVVRLASEGTESVTAEAKRRLAGTLTWDMHTERGVTPLSGCLSRLAASLVRSIEANQAELELPLEPLPIDIAGHGVP
ncbi:MAG: type II CRISPR-associated endonuclease Cas1 [Rhodospirillales bacterium]|nr:type II CRISPR-associated endonuclease Cas1 [Rhodospirillales bacterium]